MRFSGDAARFAREEDMWGAPARRRALGQGGAALFMVSGDVTSIYWRNNGDFD